MDREAIHGELLARVMFSNGFGFEVNQVMLTDVSIGLVMAEALGTEDEEDIGAGVEFVGVVVRTVNAANS